ncbi:gamma-butyrobetaine dioxygenase-like, partial [Thraustotheca clavata]
MLDPLTSRGLHRCFSALKIQQASVLAEKNKLTLTWNDGHQSQFDPVHLRAWCTCPKCQHSTGQRLVNISDIAEKPAISDVTVTPNGLSIQWGVDDKSNEPHKSDYEFAYIRSLCHSNYTTGNTANLPTPSIKPVDKIDHSEILNDKGMYKMLYTIMEHGYALVSNVPCENGQVKTFAERIAPISHQFLYGSVFDVIAEHDPVNIAYTSERLKLHLDLAYYESPPGLQFLHAYRFDPTVAGGESTFRDTFDAANTLRQRFPHHFETLTRVPATFEKIHLDRASP